MGKLTLPELIGLADEAAAAVSAASATVATIRKAAADGKVTEKEAAAIAAAGDKANTAIRALIDETMKQAAD